MRKLIRLAALMISAAGAAAGAAGGYLYDQSKKNEQKAYERGVKDGESK